MPINIITNYRNLEYFITTKKLMGRQIHWAEFLSAFNFVMFYTIIEENQKADILTYCLNNLL